MSFFQSADGYDRFMGRYSVILSPIFADFAGIEARMRVVDVGCGPGVLTAELVQRVGAGNVTAIDPSPPFVEAARERHPGVTADVGTAEQLPYADAAFDAALSQLVVHFMDDPVAGTGEMARVTRPGGVVASCTWDLAGGRSPLSPFWRAAAAADASQSGERGSRGGSRADLAQVFADAGVDDVVTAELEVHAEHGSFEEYWGPFERGVGPAGAYLMSLPQEQRDAIREHARDEMPAGPHAVTWYVWAARGIAG